MQAASATEITAELPPWVGQATYQLVVLRGGLLPIPSLPFDVAIGGGGGEPGPQGPEGPQGMQGDKGLAGNTGATGAPGPQGPQGDKGLTGDKGPTGDKGLQGDQGPPGTTGAGGTTRAALFRVPDPPGGLTYVEILNIPGVGAFDVGCNSTSTRWRDRNTTLAGQMNYIVTPNAGQEAGTIVPAVGVRVFGSIEAFATHVLIVPAGEASPTWTPSADVILLGRNDTTECRFHVRAITD